MPYFERKPIYNAYKKIVRNIIAEKQYKVYAKGEIEALNQDLLRAFQEISDQLLEEKAWPEEGK